MLRKRQRKKAVMIMLIICLVLTIVPTFAFAAPDAEEPSQGTEPMSEEPGEVIEEAVDKAEPGIEAEEAEQTETEEPAEPEVKEKAPAAGKMLTAAAKSVSIGTKIKYTGKQVGKVDQTAIFTYKEAGSGLTFTGTCRQAGIRMSKSGTGTVDSRISNNSYIAKVIYRYAVQKGWLTGKNAATNARKVLGVNYKVGFTYRRLIECACQINNMGRPAFKKAMMEVGGVSEPTVNAIINWYMNLDVSKVKVPDGFEIYKVNTANGVQPFTMWAYRNPPPPPTKNGFVALKKVSRDPSITYNGEPDEIEDNTENEIEE